MWNHVLALIVGMPMVLPAPAGLNRLEPVEVVGPAVERVNMPAELADGTEWALDLFDEAALELPPIRFVHHGGATEPCRGRMGMHRAVDGVSIIEVCTSEASFPTRLMLLHEVAHAWTSHQLTPERKAQFQELRGWEHWRDYEAAEWHENGTEQAAEILVWGLSDRPLRMARIHQASCGELEAGYLTLTGRPPLHGFRDHC